MIPSNGENTNIVIENCEFGFCHSALTCGSEAIHNKNIIMRNCYVNEATRVLWLKMRPDTPQLYEYITVENIKGQANSLIYVKPWTQFFDLQGRKDIPLSYSDNITLKNIDLKCNVFYDVAITEKNLRLINMPRVQESKSQELFYIYLDNRPNNHNEKNPCIFYWCVRFGGAFFRSEKKQ